VTIRFIKSKFALPGGIAALLLSVCCSSALASSGFKTHCSEVTDVLPIAEVSLPSLNLRPVDHGLIDAAAEMRDPAAEPAEEDLPASALAEAKTTSSTDAVEEEAEDEAKVTPVSDPPGTAVRLPGVAEKDQPRFRRQMNRTDI